ncbi:hypothetical protein RFI_31216, partial [Reticulomyxa filosa]
MLLILLRFWYSFLNIIKVQDSQQWMKQLDTQFKLCVLNHYAFFHCIQATSYFIITFSKCLYVSMATLIFFVFAFIIMSITIFRYNDIVIYMHVCAKYRIVDKLTLLIVFSLAIVISVGIVSVLMTNEETVVLVWMLGGTVMSMCHFSYSTISTVYLNRIKLFKFFQVSPDLAKQCINTLANQRGYEALMAHCSREFLSEKLLFVTGLNFFYPPFFKKKYIYMYVY